MNFLFVAAILVLEPLAGGLNRPVQVVSAHDHTGRLFIAQQDGRILLFDGSGVRPRPFLDLRSIVDCCDNGGLLSIAFHPAYEQNGQIFVLYVDLDGDTAVARFRRSPEDDSLGDPDSGEVLLVIDQPGDALPNHHGGTLQFGPDGFLYLSVGDGGVGSGVSNRAQEMHHLLGKLLRIDVDGGDPFRVPPDNPFVGMPGIRPEIWSIGLRNPWRFSFDRVSGELLIGDVGEEAWEEIDSITIEEARGANFGWPIAEGSHCFPAGTACDLSGLAPPKLEYGRDLGCSITGGYRYRGTRWPHLYGSYVYGDWCSGRIWAAKVDPAGGWSSSELADTSYAIVSFGEDDDGELYVVDYNGSVFRLRAPAVRRRAVRHEH